MYAIFENLVVIFEPFADDGLDERVDLGVLFAAECRAARFGFLLERSFGIRSLELGIEARAELL